MSRLANGGAHVTRPKRFVGGISRESLVVHRGGVRKVAPVREAVTKDLERIAELVRRAQAATTAEDWNLTIFTLRNASHSCLLLSSVLSRATQPRELVDVRDPAWSERVNRD